MELGNHPVIKISLLHLSISLLLTTLLFLQSAHSQTPVARTCPPQERRDAVIQNIRETNDNLMLQIAPIIENCGLGQWYRLASLNTSDPSQQCPSAWREYNSGGVRACGRDTSSTDDCAGSSYATGRQYSRVCGRVIGYQVGSPDAFGWETVAQIDSRYVYGVSITHGTPRNHIWTYAAGLSEGRYARQQDNCPCSNPSHPDNAYPPSFVGDNYYCESGNPADTFILYKLYPNDPLWDGEQCEGECCSNGKSPPWFSVELPNPASDDIEVRICSFPHPGDNTPVQLLELYIQ